MEIKDYLHFYIGCDCICDNGVIVRRRITPELLVKESNGFAELKPILRKLSDMTEEEKEKLFDHLWPTGLWGIAWSGKIDVIDHILDLQDHWSDLGERVQNILSIKAMSAMLNWLRKNSFDADELIPAGLAIDKTSLI